MTRDDLQPHRVVITMTGGECQFHAEQVIRISRHFGDVDLIAVNGTRYTPDRLPPVPEGMAEWVRRQLEECGDQKTQVVVMMDEEVRWLVAAIKEAQHDPVR